MPPLEPPDDDTPAADAELAADHRAAVLPREGHIVVAESEDARGELLLGVVLDTSSQAAGDDGLILAPISPEVRFASNWDLLLDEEDTSLTYPVLVEAWNHGTLLRRQLAEDRGPINPDAQRCVSALYRVVLGEPDAPDHEMVSSDILCKRGLPITDDGDPRAIFQEEETERAAQFWNPATRVLSEEAAPAPTPVSTIGPILDRWLSKRGYGPAFYAREHGLPAQCIEAICADRIDPSAVSAERLAEILFAPVRDFQEIDERELGKALARTIEPDDWSRPGALPTLRSKRKTSSDRLGRREAVLRSRGAEHSLSPLEQAQQKEAYVRDFLTALSKKRG